MWNTITFGTSAIYDDPDRIDASKIICVNFNRSSFEKIVNRETVKYRAARRRQEQVKAFIFIVQFLVNDFHQVINSCGYNWCHEPNIDFFHRFLLFFVSEQ